MATWDTIPARLLPFSLLREGNLELSEFGWLQHSERTPYFLHKTTRGELFSAYPILTPLVSTPVAIPIVWWLRHNAIDDTDARFRLAALVSERIAAALIAAVSVSLVFLCLCRLTTRTVALLLALGYGLATNTWATSSQALWQHGVAQLSLAALSLALLGRDTRANAVAASAFAGLGTLARPTMVIFALAAAAFFFRERRARLAAFLIVPAIGLVALLVYSPEIIGYMYSSQGRLRFSVPHLHRLAGLLISPNRGLLVYSPLIVLAVPAVISWRRLPRPWLRYALFGVGGYLLLYASFGGWWGGDTYGPRFLVDVIPVLVLCSVGAAEWLLRRAPGRIVLAALLVWGAAVQAIGVYCDDGEWNRDPVPLSGHSERVWDVSDLQIVRALRAGWHGTELAPLLAAALSDPRPVPLRPLTESDLSGTVEVADPLPLRYRAGGRGALRVEVRNSGTAMWPAFSDYGFLQCKVAYVWWRDGRMLAAAGGLSLPRNLGPGEAATIAASIEVPPAPGAYELELRVVQVVETDSGRVGNALRRVPVELF